MNRRLLTLLVLTLAASVWFALDDATDEEGVALVRPAPGAQVVVARASPSGSSSRDRSAQETRWPPPVVRGVEPWPVDEASFAAWLPVPPPQPVAAPRAPARPVAAVPAASAPAQAPSFPLTLIGRVIDGDTVHVLFAAPTRTVGVRIADVIDGQWRVESIGEGGVTLTWLPGGQRQTIPFRSS